MDALGRRGVATLVAAAAMVAVTACSGAASSTAPERPTPTASTRGVPATPPVGLSASLVQYRRDQPRRFVQVKLDNGTDAALDITLLDVALPGYEPPQDVRRTTHLEPGRRVDLPVALPDVVCDRDADGAASATVDVATGDGAVRTVLPVDDDGLLRRLRTFECAVRQAEAAVAIELSPSWQRQGSGATLTVRGTATVTARSPAVRTEVTELDGGVLFAIEPGAVTPTPPIVVDAQRPDTTITFDMIPARCDGHAIAEARRLTTVTFVVAVEGAEPVPLRRAPAEAGFDTLLSALRDRCDAGTVR